MTIHIDRLANGLTIAVEPMPGLFSASIGLYVKAGGRHERLEQNGIAHFLEHMAFKGTPRRDAQQIAEEIENVGGYLNAYTGKEMTAYYARVLGADVEMALDLLADILLNPLFAERDIDTERGVILQEIGQSIDTPDDIIFDWLQEVAFPDQAFGRTILGPAERVAGFSKSDLSAFVGERYSPDQIILAASGDVNPERLLAAAERLFGGMKARPAGAVQSARFMSGDRRVSRDLEQVHVALALESPAVKSDDVYAAQLYSVALGGGMSSRLFQEVREKRGLCYTIFAQAGAYSDTGMLTVYAGTGPDQVADLCNLTLDELRKSASGLSVGEIDRARAQLKAGLVMGLESPSSRAERLARMLSIWGRVPPIEEILSRIDAVTPDQIRGFAEGLMQKAEPAFVTLGPARSAPDLEAMARRMVA